MKDNDKEIKEIIEVMLNYGGTPLRQLKDGSGSILNYKNSLYFVESKEFAEGALGKVFKAYPLSEEGIIDKENVKVVKIMSANLHQYAKDEYQKAKRSINMFPPIKINRTKNSDEMVCLVQDYLGEPLDNCFETISKLSSEQFLSLLNLLARNVNELHYYRLRIDEVVTIEDPLVHRDLHSGNILFNLVSEDKEFKIKGVDIIDFGLAVELKDPNPNRLHSSAEPLIAVHQPPEAVNDKHYGMKTDIYQLAAIFAVLFGYNNNDLKSYDGVSSYQLDNFLLEKSWLKRLEFDDQLNKIIVDFINRMRDTQYEKRPNSDEVLKFTSLLANYYKNQIKKVSLPKEMYSVKINKQRIFLELLSLSQGQWEKYFPPVVLEKDQKIDQENDQEIWQTDFHIINQADKLAEAFERKIQRGSVTDVEKENFYKHLLEYIDIKNEKLVKKLKEYAHGSLRWQFKIFTESLKSTSGVRSITGCYKFAS